MKTNLRGGILRAVGVALVGALVAVGGAGAAQADPEPSTPQVSLINPNQKGSITIHKLEFPNGAEDLPRVDGVQDDSITGEPVAGITFAIQKVKGYDLTTIAGWAALTGLEPADLTDGDLEDVDTETTTEAGIAVFDELPVGLYLIKETAWPTGVTPLEPFLIALPLTNPTNHTEWMYDLHIYPKNPVTRATKEVVDAAAIKLGDTVTFTIKGDIPDTPIDGYKIVDHLDPRLTYVPPAQVTLTNGAEFEPDDYTIEFDDTTNTVTILFSQTSEWGNTTLINNHEAQVQVVINTTVKGIGEITNEALVYPNAASFEPQPNQGGPAVTPPVQTKWGNVTIQKVNKEWQDVLGGAIFAIYPTKADAVAGTNAIQTSDELPWTGRTAGEWTFEGLRYSGWANGKKVERGQAGYQSYWIAELQAPPGYELLAEPIEVIVKDADTLVDYQIDNRRRNGGIELPLTGGVGTVAITVAGVLLIAGAVLLAVRNRRRETTNG